MKHNPSVTQILTCLTTDSVVMAADRRLTGLSTGEVEDDETCKLVVAGSHFAVGYTGLANLRPPPRGQTDLWITDALRPYPTDPKQAVEQLRANATETMRQITHLGPQAKRHAFVLAGWHSPGRPFVTIVSNARDLDGGWKKYADRIFSTFTRTLDSANAILEVTGQPIPRTRRAAVERDLAENHSDPRAILYHLVAALRDVGRQNQAVGPGILAIVLPASAVADMGGIALEVGDVDNITQTINIPPFQPEAATGFYFPSDSANAGDPTLYAPNYIDLGIAITSPRGWNRVLTPEEIKACYEQERLAFE
jgi:hypothetical protein